MVEGRRYTIGEPSVELRRFEAELKAAHARPASVETYVTRSETFPAMADR
jgi:hypothetical protein